jgi:hypothetical protein
VRQKKLRPAAMAGGDFDNPRISYRVVGEEGIKPGQDERVPVRRRAAALPKP